MKKAILATKVGMTQIFDETGALVPVTVQLAGSQQIHIKSPFMLLNIPQVSLSPHAHWLLFFFGQ